MIVLYNLAPMADDGEDDPEIEALKELVDATAFVMAVNDPSYRNRKAVERGEIAVPRRYRMMAIYAVKFIVDATLKQEAPLDS
jgi:hypothetical protein